MESNLDKLLWEPSPQQIATSELTRFADEFMSAHGAPSGADYNLLHRLTIEHAEDFWSSVWDFCQIPGEQGDVRFVSGERLIDARWFPNGRLNFAEALLRPQQLTSPDIADSLAIFAVDEKGQKTLLTRGQLYAAVASFAGFLRSRGVVAGDRVAAVLPNIPAAVIALLATAAIGATWSSCSPDFGEDAIVDRFGQIEPKLLITSRSTTYNHKIIEPVTKVAAILPRLSSVETVVVVGEPTSTIERALPGDKRDWVAWQEALGSLPYTDWPLFPFAHPLCIVYSSGTTGPPKCMVHGIGGTILQHVKEHQLHCDMKAGDVLFYYTTTGWMMWNWLVSGLASQATIVLYDGSPFANGPETLLKLASDANVTHFGAGARYYAALERHGCKPTDHLHDDSLRCLLSTGSPLLPSNFEWMYAAFGDNFNLASISGGTDILSCFVLGNPNRPVHSGRIQCKGLGMDVQVFDPEGLRLIDAAGELVCVNPFPSMPIYFWNDPQHKKYLSAYFERFPDVWCHGDWAEENQQGEFIIYGRSDATLNPGGVRIGTAEIYQQLEKFPEISEAIATVLRGDGDEQIVLFVRLFEDSSARAELAERIRTQLRACCSPRHVPRFIDYAPDLPRTISGKLSEIAVRSAICGQDLGNTGALANPEALNFFQNWKAADAY